MAVTAGLTGTNQTVGATEEALFVFATQGEGKGVIPPSSLMVRCNSGVNVIVRIPKLHGATGGVNIPIGEKEYFRVQDGQLTEAYVSGNGAVIDWGVVAATRS